MRVLGNRVLVKRIEDEGLKSKYIEVIQSEERKEPGTRALVAGVGPGQRLPDGRYIPIEVVEGDVVIIKKYSGFAVTLHAGNGQSEEFHMVDANDVLGKFVA